MCKNGYLADDVDLKKLSAITKNFSGAEIEGLVNAATSFALYGTIRENKEEEEKEELLKEIKVTMGNFMEAIRLNEVKPAFGVSETDLRKYLPISVL